MKRLRQWLCILLVFALFPGKVALAASTDDTPTQIRARAFRSTGEVVEFSAILREGNYYITEDVIPKLTGFQTTVSGKTVSFQGQAGQYRYNLNGVVDYPNKKYYLLTELLDKAKVIYFVNNAGELGFRTVLYDYDRLIALGEEIMSNTGIDANFWDNAVGLGDFIYGFANVYDVISGLRFDAMWGKAYYDDIKKLFLDLVKPLDSEKNLFEKIEKANKKLGTAVGIAQKVRGAMDNFEALANLDDLPPGADRFLFGESWRPGLREALDAYEGVNSNICDEIFAEMVNQSDAAFYKKVMEEQGQKVLNSYGKYGIGDILRTGGYILSVINASVGDTEALSKMLDWYRDNDDMNPVLRRAGLEVVYGVRHAAKDDLLRASFLSSELMKDFVFSGASNGFKDAFTKSALGIQSFWVKLEKEVFNWSLGISTRTDAVRYLYMYNDIQQIFQDCFRANAYLQNGVPQLSNAETVYASLQIYLKSCHRVLEQIEKMGEKTVLEKWISGNDIPVIPTSRLSEVLEDFDQRFAEFSPSDFRYEKGSFISAGSLWNLDQNTSMQQSVIHPLEEEAVHTDLDDPVITTGEIPSAPGLPDDYAEFLRWGWIDDVVKYWNYDYEDVLWPPATYCLYDVDSNGIPELIVQYDGNWLIYTRISGRIQLVSSGILARDMGVFVCPELHVVWFEGAHTSWSFACFVGIEDGREIFRFDNLEKEDPSYQGFKPEEVSPRLKGNYYLLPEYDVVGVEIFA